MKMRVLFACLVVAVVGLSISPLMAHSEVFERAPASGQVLGGTVDHIDISFWAPVASGEILLAGPDDRPISVGETTLLSNGRVVTTDFEALVEPGRYVVTHTELADDGDIQTASFAFTFDPESDARLTSLVARDDGPNWVLLGGVTGVILLLAGFFWPGRSRKAS